MKLHEDKWFPKRCMISFVYAYVSGYTDAMCYLELGLFVTMLTGNMVFCVVCTCAVLMNHAHEGMILSNRDNANLSDRVWQAIVLVCSFVFGAWMYAMIKE